MPAPNHIVENHLEGPWPRDAHHGLHEHRAKYERQTPSVWADKITDQTEHGVIRLASWCQKTGATVGNRPAVNRESAFDAVADSAGAAAKRCK
jgi:hypothetical protein